VHRHEVSDAQYARLQQLLPEPRHHGEARRPWLPHHTVINGILRILKTRAALARSVRTLRQMEHRSRSLQTLAAQWHLDAPPRCPPGRTRRSCAAGVRSVVHRRHSRPCRPLRGRRSSPQLSPPSDGRRGSDGTRRVRRECVGLLPRRFQHRGPPDLRQPRHGDSASMLRLGSVTRARLSSQPCSGCICGGVEGSGAGRVRWWATRVQLPADLALFEPPPDRPDHPDAE